MHNSTIQRQNCTDPISYLDHPVVAGIFLHDRKCKLVVYSRFKKASKVCNFHFNILDLILPNKRCINHYTKCPLIIIHIIIQLFLLLQDYLPAVANWFKLSSYICMILNSTLAKEPGSTNKMMQWWRWCPLSQMLCRVLHWPYENNPAKWLLTEYRVHTWSVCSTLTVSNKYVCS